MLSRTLLGCVVFAMTAGATEPETQTVTDSPRRVGVPRATGEISLTGLESGLE
jgi:hypothetical protein